MMGALAPIRIVAPRSLPGLRALGRTLMQCMHFTHSGLSIARALPSHTMQRVGHMLQTSRTMSTPPSTYSRTLAWSTWMSSFHVPMIDMSDRATEATQSFGHPANLNLNLYGNAGRCSSSWKRWVMSLHAFSVS